MFAARRIPSTASRCSRFIRLYSENAATTEAPKSPPILTSIRSDLKTALKAKDKNKLAIIRSILAEVMNASTSKPPKPLNTDLEVVALLQKLKARARESIAEAKAAGREDLVAKEEQQIAALESYVGRVKTMSDEEIEKEIQTIIERMKGQGVEVKMPTLMKEVTKLLEDKAPKSNIAAQAVKLLKAL